MKDKITQRELNSLPRTAIQIKRSMLPWRSRLTVFSRANTGREYLKLFSVRCSTGALGFETPAGQCLVLDKEMPPTYTAPNSEWAKAAGYTPGQLLPTDHPANPLRGAWIRLTDDGIGIHGSDSFQKASHGCIRVKPKDAIAIHEAVELGSPVAIL